MEPFLSGVRVLDLTRLLPGPYATTLLADLGAEVVKVEEPTRGDPVRHREPTVGGRSYTYLVRNRNKASVGVDLKDERGHEAFMRLAETADVVVESFRPGVVDRLGVGYEAVRAVNEDVVYCSLTGYGQTGPYADSPGHDVNYAGVAGLLALTGNRDGAPTIPGYPVGDFAGGLYAAFAIAAAVAGVAAGKSGEYIDVSMTDAVASFSTAYADRYFAAGATPEREGTRLLGRHPGYRVYEAGDGEYLTVSALEARFWNNLCDALDRPDLRDAYVGRDDDVSAARRREIVDEVAAAMAERPRADLLAAFEEHDVPGAPVNGYDDLFQDPHLAERDLFDSVTVETKDGATETVGQVSLPVQFGRDRTVEKEAASRLGADTDRYLAAVGYDAETVAELAADGVVTLGEDF
jgi:crotonobetainyl-CoA:carnitine CoA-transferase CaiB-like acyl-CoA transferase